MATPIVALVGRTNTGKSRLYNALCGRPEALVSKIEHLTRDWRETVIDVGDLDVRLRDTAGMPESGDSLSKLIERQTRQQISDADVLLLVVDARAGLMPLDRDFANLVRRSGKPVVVVINKMDTITGRQIWSEFSALGFAHNVQISAERHLGLDVLRSSVVEAVDESLALATPVLDKVAKVATLDTPPPETPPPEATHPETTPSETTPSETTPVDAQEQAPADVGAGSARAGADEAVEQSDAATLSAEPNAGQGAEEIPGQNIDDSPEHSPDQSEGKSGGRGEGKSEGKGRGEGKESGTRPRADPESELSVVVCGLSNSGKSTLINRLSGNDRLLVHDEQGTTREPIGQRLHMGGQSYEIFDTCGFVRRGDVVQYLSDSKTTRLIDKANLALYLIDASRGPVRADLRKISEMINLGQNPLIVCTKIDLIDRKQREAIDEELKRQLEKLAFISKPLWISAHRGAGLRSLPRKLRAANEEISSSFPTNRLTRILLNAVSNSPPPTVDSRRIRLRYAHQGGSRPLLVVVHGKQTHQLKQPYKRYLSKIFCDELGLKYSVPRIVFSTDENPYATPIRK